MPFSQVAKGLLQKKKQTGQGIGGGGGGHTFLRKPLALEFFIFLIYPWKFQTKQSSTP